MDCVPKRMGYDDDDDDDRLTLLPDEALTRILSLLPTKDAALLTLISKNKLMPAFSVLTNFEFDDFPISHCLSSPNLVERTPTFKIFVDYVLRNCQSKQLASFTLCFGRFCRDMKRDYIARYLCGRNGECHPPLEPDRLNSWLSFPLSRRVRELDLCINVQLSQGCRILPRSIFVCETLEMLKLDSNLDIGVDDVKTFPIRLPRLKLIHLRNLIFTKDEFVTKLVNSCPVLEDLLLDCSWECGDVFAISSPSLLKFDLILDRCDDQYKGSSSVIIKTPNVQSFRYDDNFAEHYSISYMNAIVEADITIGYYAGQGDECFKLCSFLKSCSDVSHLTLQSDALWILDSVLLKYHLPVFVNLNYLELRAYDCYCLWNKVLVKFLERSPCLQTLVFPEGLTYEIPSDEEERAQLELECMFWRRTNASPSCCKSHLKRIVINKFLGLQYELALIGFLLQKAMVLESLDISISKTREDLDLDAVSIQSALRKIPRASTICSITVL